MQLEWDMQCLLEHGRGPPESKWTSLGRKGEDIQVLNLYVVIHYPWVWWELELSNSEHVGVAC